MSKLRDHPQSMVHRELSMDLPGEPDSAAVAWALVSRLRGASEDQLDDVRLLLNSLVATAHFEGAEFVDVRMSSVDGRLRLEVVSPSQLHHGERHPTPATELDRHLIHDLSDRWGRDGGTLWCELDGTWAVDPE